LGVGEGLASGFNGEPDPTGDGEGVGATDGEESGVGDSLPIGEGEAFAAGEGVGVADGNGIKGKTCTLFFPLAAIAPLDRLPATPTSTKTG
jgi:hypothetical protein